jgi:hypothetical protein
MQMRATPNEGYCGKDVLRDAEHNQVQPLYFKNLDANLVCGLDGLECLLNYRVQVPPHRSHLGMHFSKLLGSFRLEE